MDMPQRPSLWRPELLKALELLARASEAMLRRGLPRPILVGGGAAEYYSASALMTGDIDLVSPAQPELEQELMNLGFIRPSGAGQCLRGLIHPGLALGFEVVATTLMDSAVDPGYIVLVEDLVDGASFAVTSVEDLIADRMGQYASGSAPEMLDQARALFALHPDADLEYLERRIRHESLGDHGIEDLL